ncbi:protein SlyX [Devosia geojensis]|uniref:Protein SlyX homolog n=1 Tax=Devosia geojensis TaxID=443610 RepID=A0A0F5FVR1_9HYPH|nr:SlyX family protein [Devosia geojensis]KKB12971.1 protein SlyX [Devosia geojensis]
MTGSDAERIEALEVRVAYQEQAIEDLNTVITDQWKVIEALQRKLARLEEELAEAELSARAGGAVERPPPHY